MSTPEGVRREQHRLPAAFTDFVGLPEASADDVVAVRQVLALFGHTVDNDAWHELEDLLAPDAALHAGTQTIDGRDAVIAWFAEQPLRPSHHTVNTVIRTRGDAVLAWSRLVTIAGDGSVASADALDRLVQADGAWRIAHRGLHARHAGDPASDEQVRAWLA